MLTKETEQKLVQILITLSSGEEKIDKLKKDILANFNINPLQFFFKLDINKSNYLTKNDIITYLNSFSIVYTPTDIDYIFYFYDKDSDGVLNFYEFLDILISNSNYLYKKSFKKKYKYNKIGPNEINGEIDNEMQKKVLQIFIEEIEFARQLNELVVDIKSNKDFNIQNIYYEIKSYSYITVDSMKAFFDRNEVAYNDKFIKNIFGRFNTKEINDRISFNKLKHFFDLPNTINTKITENIQNSIYNYNSNQNLISPIINQTQISEDININNSEMNFTKIQNYNYNENINNIIMNASNDINDEDIQFECSHLSRSGSLNSKNGKNNNCGYCTKDNVNMPYKNYLREKRSKSLEKSLSSSLSRKNTQYLNHDKLKNDNKKQDIKNIRNIRVIVDDNYSENEEGNIGSNTNSNNEDLPINMPERLDRNIVKRKIPQRKIIHQKKNESYLTYRENNNKCHCNCSHCNNYFDENDKENIQYNNGIYEGISTNNLDVKIYQEDMGSRINYQKYGNVTNYKY